MFGRMYLGSSLVHVENCKGSSAVFHDWAKKSNKFMPGSMKSKQIQDHKEASVRGMSYVTLAKGSFIMLLIC